MKKIMYEFFTGYETDDIRIKVITVITMVLAYFMGNISPATIIGRIMGIDIKKEGSGNAGTTNVLRVLGAKAAVLTLAVDVLKGVAAVLIGYYAVGIPAAMLCAPSVTAGHIWPVLLRFKGGKGVATIFGALTALEPLMGLTALALVAAAAFISRRASVGSIVGAVALPFIAWFFMPKLIVIACLLGALVLFSHRSNIIRLVKGEEPRINFGGKS
ncbi:MAG: glycerol-3-phosphate 1-O-acyltransferase PlsY [Eubacteriales bacterium]|nr:glycerol-3-phosphate 1-O-acyltransferase PlsY [Eubacteriales bacterium]